MFYPIINNLIQPVAYPVVTIEVQNWLTENNGTFIELTVAPIFTVVDGIQQPLELSIAQLRDIKKSNLKELREIFINSSTINYLDKEFEGKREKGSEFDKYANDFRRAVAYGVKNETDVVTSWRTNDNTYIDLSIVDVETLSMKCSEVISIAFRKQAIAEIVINATLDDDLNTLDISMLFDNAE